MATVTAIKSAHPTLSTTTADTVNLNDEWTVIEVINRSGTAPIYVRTDGVTAVAAADETDVVMPGEAVLISRVASGGISVVGDSNEYSVVGVG
jgi:hypothetical protein